MQCKRVVLHSFFMAKHSFIKTAAKLYFAVAKVFLFALVLINVSVLSKTILERAQRSERVWLHCARSSIVCFHHLLQNVLFSSFFIIITRKNLRAPPRPPSCKSGGPYTTVDWGLLPYPEIIT